VVATGVLLQTSPMSAMALSRRTSRSRGYQGKTRRHYACGFDDADLARVLKKTGLKEGDFTTVAGDAQTKLNAVINGQADLLPAMSWTSR